MPLGQRSFCHYHYCDCYYADHSLGKVRGHHLGWGHQADEGQEEEPGCAPRPLFAAQAQGSDSGLLHRGSENAA